MMPVQAPVFGRAAASGKRKAWARDPAYKDPRKRGRAGMRDRAAVLDEEPFCRLCLTQGREVASDVVDHIRPLAWGGSDDRANKQALCTPCHDAKSKAERASAARAGAQARRSALGR